MYEQIEKPKENKKKQSVNPAVQNKSYGRNFFFADNRNKIGISKTIQAHANPEYMQKSSSTSIIQRVPNMENGQKVEVRYKNMAPRHGIIIDDDDGNMYVVKFGEREARTYPEEYVFPVYEETEEDSSSSVIEGNTIDYEPKKKAKPLKNTESEVGTLSEKQTQELEFNYTSEIRKKEFLSRNKGKRIEDDTEVLSQSSEGPDIGNMKDLDDLIKSPRKSRSNTLPIL